jgi:hypothetical protein
MNNESKKEFDESVYESIKASYITAKLHTYCFFKACNYLFVDRSSAQSCNDEVTE